MSYPRTHNLFGSSFGGIEMRQYWADLALWELFLNEFKDIRTVVELGTFHGGLTIFLKAQTLARDQHFFTLDRDVPQVLYTPFGDLVSDHFLHGDFWQDTHAQLLDILHAPELKPLLLFVDGGNKPREFAAFVPELSTGDYVGVHDYGTEFKPEAADPVDHLLEPVFWDQCTAPPQPCLTRFWRRL